MKVVNETFPHSSPNELAARFRSHGYNGIMTWNQVIGHEWATESLAAAIKHNRVGHAYLITGPSQIGKTTLARTFAQALNCLDTDLAPDGTCRPCTLIASDRHPDVRLIEPDVSARGKLSLKIETMRQLQSALQRAAVEARHKVAIVRNFDAATVGAANAFLKTLEEPPPNVVLLLTATDADALLDTIRSRCRVLALRPLSQVAIEQALVDRWAVPSEQATLLAHLANGRLGWAVKAATDPSILESRAARIALLEQSLHEKRVGRFQMADGLAKQTEHLMPTLQLWTSYWRDLLLIAYENGDRAVVVNVDRQPFMRNYVGAVSAEAIQRALTATQTAIWQLNRNANTRLALENLLLSYPIVGTSQPA